MRTQLRKCLAEFLGTFALVAVGVGSVLFAEPGAALLTIALAHGLVLAVFITACFYISGAQFNPAVSFALVLIGKQPPKQGVIFALVQLAAAACGAGLWLAILGPEVANSAEAGTNLGATIGELTRDGRVGAVLLVEVVATFLLMWAILAGTVDKRAQPLGGFVIGVAVTALILAFGPATGAGMNPARTFGPALFGHWEMFWVYVLGPVIGASLAAVVYARLWEERPEDLGWVSREVDPPAAVAVPATATAGGQDGPTVDEQTPASDPLHSPPTEARAV